MKRFLVPVFAPFFRQRELVIAFEHRLPHRGLDVVEVCALRDRIHQTCHFNTSSGLFGPLVALRDTSEHLYGARERPDYKDRGF
jgi:hypothetical protein